MKNLNRLRQQLAYEPFQSFWLETVGGTRIQVKRREWFWEIPDLDSFVVAHRNGAVSFGLFSDLTDLIEVETPVAPNKEFPRAEFRAPKGER